MAAIAASGEALLLLVGQLQIALGELFDVDVLEGDDAYVLDEPRGPVHIPHPGILHGDLEEDLAVVGRPYVELHLIGQVEPALGLDHVAEQSDDIAVLAVDLQRSCSPLLTGPVSGRTAGDEVNHRAILLQHRTGPRSAPPDRWKLPARLASYRPFPAVRPAASSAQPPGPAARPSAHSSAPPAPSAPPVRSAPAVTGPSATADPSATAARPAIVPITLANECRCSGQGPYAASARMCARVE